MAEQRPVAEPLEADELAEAQRRLARALGKARAGEDREFAQRVRENGEALAQMLAGLLKMSRVHAADNRAFDVPVGEFARALGELTDLVGVVHLVAVGDQAYVNEMRLRAEGRPGIDELGAELARHNVGGMSFPDRLETPAVRALVAAFAAPPGEPYPRQAVRARLAAAGVKNVGLQGIYRFRTTDDRGDLGPDPEEALRRAHRLSAEAWEALAAGRNFSPLSLRRAVSEILEIGPSAPGLWSVWVAGPIWGDHSLAVMMHVLLLGEAVGLARAVLQDLGVAALVHDVGYAAMGGGASTAGPDGLARHPGEGARVLLRHRGFSEAKIRRLRAVLDHHRSNSEPRGQASLIGSLMRIAEDYGNLLRVHGERITPADVLGAMAGGAVSVYQPALIQLFVNALGSYPPGTMLELADGRRARSAAPVRTPDTFAAPLARICDPVSGKLGEVVDLAKGPAIKRARGG